MLCLPALCLLCACSARLRASQLASKLPSQLTLQTGFQLTRYLAQVMDAVNISAFLQEASIMTRLAGGPHVVALHGACVDDQSLVVVMELLEVRFCLPRMF